LAQFDQRAFQFGRPNYHGRSHFCRLGHRRLVAYRAQAAGNPDSDGRRTRLSGAHGEPRSPHDLVHHEALLFRDPQTGRPFPWEFKRGGETVEVKVSSRLMMDDPFVAVSACLAGQSVFQMLAVGLAPFLSRGEFVQVLPDWSEELYPLYAYHPSRRLPPAKVRAFLDFIQEIAV
jgi:DNA-binding transcriptional LysR family regulator